MCEIEKIDAFSLVVKAMEKGDEKTANRMLQIIMKSIRQSQKVKSKSNLIEIRDEKDAQLFREFLLDTTEK